jgi:predicted HicB family RNase H-like nuclease
MRNPELNSRRSRRKKLVVRVEPPLEAAIKLAAAKAGRSISNFIRQITAEHIENTDKAA